MSYRDRQGQSPSLYDSNNRPRRDDSSQPTGGAGPREQNESAGRPWHVDPAEVDRYLAEREQAIRLERPDSYQSNRQGNAPSQPGDRANPRSATNDYSARSRRNQSLPDPADYQWPDLDDDQWSTGDDTFSDPYTDPYEPKNEPATVPPARTSGTRRRTATLRTPRRPRTARSVPQIRLPRFVTSAALVADRTALLMLAVTGFSVVVMWIIFANRINHVGSIVPLHLDAVGVPDEWGPAKALWSLPLLATMVPLMNLAIAWTVARFDLFASRFLLATSLCLQLLVWIAAIRILW